MMAPPASGPAATPMPAIADQMPSAADRRSGGKALARIVSVSGMRIALPTPCNVRAATSSPRLPASAPAAEAAVKIKSPMTNMRLRPKRSPNAAPVRMSTANVRM